MSQHYSSDSEISDDGRNANPGANQASLAGPARVRRSSIRRRVAAPDYTPPLRNATAPAAAGGPTRPVPRGVSATAAELPLAVQAHNWHYVPVFTAFVQRKAHKLLLSRNLKVYGSDTPRGAP
ncbi:hypothetical protein PtB15_5B612 [Puccinia triticina]|nr:hypothetical protein PtB15_5B612 [Puccinia triticina]